jgi:hypothetical protein
MAAVAAGLGTPVGRDVPVLEGVLLAAVIVLGPAAAEVGAVVAGACGATVGRGAKAGNSVSCALEHAIRACSASIHRIAPAALARSFLCAMILCSALDPVLPRPAPGAWPGLACSGPRRHAARAMKQANDKISDAYFARELSAIPAGPPHSAAGPTRCVGGNGWRDRLFVAGADQSFMPWHAIAIRAGRLATRPPRLSTARWPAPSWPARARLFSGPGPPEGTNRRDCYTSSAPQHTHSPATRSLPLVARRGHGTRRTVRAPTAHSCSAHTHPCTCLGCSLWNRVGGRRIWGRLPGARPASALASKLPKSAAR